MAVAYVQGVARAVPGVRLGTAQAGIKKKDRDDLLIIEADEGAVVAAVFTQNAFCAAPVLVAREHLQAAPRWLLVNSGNANAGTGPRGLRDAQFTCEALAQKVGQRGQKVLPFSTGVIGEYLPVEKIEAALPQALSDLREDHWEQAARAIMTTDTYPKVSSQVVDVAGYPVTVTGISKGAGMIQPNMATMLAFIATDASVEKDVLQALLGDVADRTFNCITVDGDTSTNDACVLMASGKSPLLSPGTPEFDAFSKAVHVVLGDLSEAIVRDGEGATKLIRIQVEGARDREEARTVGKTIAHSPLVKTAFFASDPNWGRILAAVGRAGCEDLVIENVAIWLDEVQIVEAGGRCADYTEEAGARVMAQTEILIRVALGRGEARETVLTCDFSYDYVRINAEYRT
jgi:glutamate N-acetyltransferase/amino-acid N-acetyltransferase